MKPNRNIGRTLVLALVLFGLVSGPSSACGWWGDGEDDISTDAELITPDTVTMDIAPTAPAAMARLSDAYRRGSGVPLDPQLALYWAKKASESGHIGAMNDLGQMYETGFAGPIDAEAAVRWYRLAAAQGLASAQHSLAIMLRKGTGVDPDPEAANVWLRRSAAQGHPAATADLASWIWSGKIVAQDPNEGCFWWLVALKQGFEGSPQRCRDEKANLSDAEFLRITEMANSWLPSPEIPGESADWGGS